MGAKPCLLVVDDEPDLIQSVQDLLRFDYRVLGASCAADGLRIMECEPVQIVMSDQRMPEMTGVELLRRIKDLHPETVRLLFTAYADIGAVIDAINEGNVYRYISKPWEVEELKAVLRQAFEFYQLQEERRKLLQEVQAKNAQLEVANSDLRRANELKRSFIKVASHELRTSLTVLLGYADLAMQMSEKTPELHRWISLMHQSGLRLNDRVDQIVKQMLSDRYDRALQPKETDAADLVRSAVREVDQFAALRKQQLASEVADGLGTIFVERDKIHDTLVQLLINAIKFTPDGGAIRVAATRNGDSLRIAVADTGIAPDCQTRVFDPFFTGFDVSRHSSGTFDYDKRGLGLGLSKARAFVEMHGGKITVTSEVGKGATFTMELPARFDPTSATVHAVI